MSDTRRAARGFTLVELLVVLAIVGIVAGGASLALDSIRANDTEDAVERLRRVLEAAAERAQVRGRPLAVDFVGDGYRFAELQTDGRWRPLEEAPLFVSRTLPPPLRIGTLLTGTTPASAERHGTRLVFGARAPRFELTLSGSTGSTVLAGDPTGRVLRRAAAEGAR